MRRLGEALGLAAMGAIIGGVLVLCLTIGQARQLAALKSADVAHAQAQAGAGFTCWSEDNDQMPEGYEVLCDPLPAP